MAVLKTLNSHSLELLNMADKDKKPKKRAPREEPQKEAKDLYTIQEDKPADQLRGFKTTFTKRTAEKKAEDKDLIELLTLKREGKLVYGTKVTEKSFKNGTAKKVFVAANCDDLSLRKIQYYAKLAGVDVVKMELENSDLAEKLGKPFLVTMALVRK